MNTKEIKSWRKTNEVLTSAMSIEELEKNSNKDGMITAKVVVDLDSLIDNNIEILNDTVSERITGSECGLTDISYKIAGATVNNEVILKVTGCVEFSMVEEI